MNRCTILSPAEQLTYMTAGETDHHEIVWFFEDRNSTLETTCEEWGR